MKLYWTPARGFHDREGYKVDWIVLHYTAASYPGDLNYLARSPWPGCASAHFYIRKNGDIHQMVRLENAAHHAGIVWKIKGTWQYKRWKALRPNERSVGIEIENMGTEEFTQEQYTALEFLLPALLWKYRIYPKTMPDPYRGCDPSAKKDAYDIEDFEGFRGLLAHGNIHYSKVDPGLKFDWSRLMSCEPIYIPGCLTAFQNAILNSDFRFFNGERYA